MNWFYNLPNPARAAVALFTGTSLLGSLYMIDYRLAAIITAGSFLLGMVVAAYYTIRGWLQRRRAVSMVGDLQQQSTNAPAALSDINKRAKLEDLRQKFAAGVAKFGSVEHVYQFPWYLIVGEPGGGKSEAIRHCNVGFPSGMQDELQGVGGTINMNWWFTNHAVFLDTAGRLMFEEIKPGETNEWKEFLQLLVRNRPTCPINGLLLVIPADALIKDSEEEINRKAGKIAEQFALIQRTLDIRFPVFVVLTKCDLLTGFREFFDDVNDAQGQQQMLGWSNPLDRDQPFQPELVTEHIETVVERVKRRRLSLLRDPVPQKGMERRIDEVDALYSFPQSLQLIAPRLRFYLEKIFVAGPWAPKPLFLRGIYFSSSMREGAALDQELALALGLPLDQLPEGRTWERERAYFLRDLFIDKVFREKGLVTRATNTRKMLRARSIILWGSSTALALAFLGFTIWGYTAFQNSINGQKRFWVAASEEWHNGVWHPLVAPANPGGTVSLFRGDETVLTGLEGSVALVPFHARLRELTSTEIQTPLVYRPWRRLFRIEGDRKRAQRIAFEGSAVSPLLKAARQRMLTERLEDAPEAKILPERDRLTREAEALAALLRVESDAISKDRNVAAVPEAITEPLLRYSTAKSEPVDEPSLRSLGDTLTWTYTANPSGVWPPKWLPIGSTALEANQPIENGLSRFKTLALATAKTQVENLTRLQDLRNELLHFREKEIQLDKTVPLAELAAVEKAARMDGLMEELKQIKLAIDGKLRAGIDARMFEANRLAISQAYESLVSNSEKGSLDAVNSVRDAVKAHLADPDHRLFKQVDDFLTTTQAELRDMIKEGFKEDELKQLKDELDPLLAEYEPGRRVYEVRWAQYSAAQEQTRVQDQLTELIGSGWAPLSELRKKVEGHRSQLGGLEEKLTKPFSATCRYYLDRALSLRTTRIVTAYKNETRTGFDNLFFYPLVTLVSGTKKGMTREEIPVAKDLMAIWERELTSELFKSLEPGERVALENFLTELKSIDVVGNVAALNSSITVTVVGFPESSGAGTWRGVSLGGQIYDIGAGASPSVRLPYGGTFSATFYDFPQSSTMKDRVSVAAKSLLGNASVSVGSGAYARSMRLRATSEGVDPAHVRRPDKQRILNTLPILKTLR